VTWVVDSQMGLHRWSVELKGGRVLHFLLRSRATTTRMSLFESPRSEMPNSTARGKKGGENQGGVEYSVDNNNCCAIDTRRINLLAKVTWHDALRIVCPRKAHKRWLLS
jgi:hypothetical protein